MASEGQITVGDFTIKVSESTVKKDDGSMGKEVTVEITLPEFERRKKISNCAPITIEDDGDMVRIKRGTQTTW